MNILQHEGKLYIDLDLLIQALGQVVLNPKTTPAELPGVERVYRNLQSVMKQAQDNLGDEGDEGAT